MNVSRDRGSPHTLTIECPPGISMISSGRVLLAILRNGEQMSTQPPQQPSGEPIRPGSQSFQPPSGPVPQPAQPFPPHYSQPMPPPGWQPQQPYAPPMPARRPRRALWIGIAAALLLFCCIGGIAAVTNGNKSSSPSSGSATAAQAPTTRPTPRTPTPSPTPTPTYAHFGDGTFQVGKDIQPGTYRTRVGSSGCYFARLSGFGGTLDEIIANDNTDDPTVVTIAATDKGFQSERCGTWTQDISQITQSKTTFGDGIYIVGTDITPGTYRNTGSEGCYYARLSGFGHTFDNIITNNNTDTQAIVTIKATDKGFQATRCGTWTKQ